MREPRASGDRLARTLMALLPRAVARDAFEPAWHDLRNERLRRGTPGALHAARLLLLLADCWRLALADALTGALAGVAGALRRPALPPADPTPEERSAMALHLLRLAFRRLAHEPAFTLTALLTLALGVGANVAVFAVVEAALLRPLPFPEPDALVVLNHRDQRTGITKEFIAIGDYLDLTARQSAFEALATYGGGQLTVLGDDAEPFRAEALRAGPGLLELLRVRPALGRALRPEDSRPGADPVVMLGHELWRTRYGADPRVIGRTIRVEQRDWQVVGVAPPGVGFPGTTAADLIVPMTLPLQAPAQRKAGWVFAVGRLRPGVTVQRAAADLAAVSRQLEREYPQSNQASAYFPLPLRNALLGDTRTALVLLLAAVGVVLLIACANVANLLLARAVGRRREMSVRLALGAGRGRLAAQLLAEGLALSAVAAAAGVVLAHWGARALVALLPESAGAPGLDTVRIGGPVLAFALGIVVLTTLAFGLVAALAARADQPAGALGATVKASMGGAARRAMSTFVVAEVAFAVVLLFAAGLILRSFAGLLSTDPGFRTDGVTTVEVQLPGDRYADVAARDAFYRRAFAELRAVPGVREVGAGVVVPLTGNNWTVPFERPEQPVPAGERPPEVGWQAATGGYFRALGIPLVAGRLFDERERPGGANVVIVSEAIQRRFFGGESAVGRQVKLGEEDRFEIVGVVGDVRRAGLQDEPRADMYFPFGVQPQTQVTFFVHTAGDPDAALPALRGALRAVEPRLLVLDARSMADVASESVRVTRLVFLLLGLFATTALALAAVGIYGVMSYAVRLRAREIGTRIAIGASGRDIHVMVLRQGARLAAAGALVGLGVGLAATRLLRSVLHGVSPTDPATLAASLVVLLAAVAAACWVPARRAAATDPARTLADP